MVLLANRVSALELAPIKASTSSTPRPRAASVTRPKISSQRSRGSSSGICASDLHLAEARGRGAMSGAHYLLRLPLATIRRPPQRPVLRSRDGRAGIPKLRRDAAIARVFQHARALSLANLPADLAAELKVVALVVDRPA